MFLEKYRKSMVEGFHKLESENLSDDGIKAVCAIRKAAEGLFEQTKNYQDALMLFNRLSKSVVDDNESTDIFGSSFWDEKEKVIEKKAETQKEEPIAEPVRQSSSVRGSGRLASDYMKSTEVTAEADNDESLFDEELQEIETTEVSSYESTGKSFEDEFKGKFETDLTDAFAEDASFVEDEEIIEIPDERSYFDEYEEGVFEFDDIPEGAISYADDPYLLADEIIENLEEEDLALFLDEFEEEGESLDDIVHPDSLEVYTPKSEPAITSKEAVENARDKFYMPAKSRIAMIRGVEPEEGFNAFDLLADEYKTEPSDEQVDTGIPTQDEIRDAETEFEDEYEVEGVGKEVQPVLEEVEAPEDEIAPDTGFDIDQLGIAVEKAKVMSDEEYDTQYRIDMTKVIAEQSAQSESYQEKMEQIANISFVSPVKSENEEE